MDKNLTLTLYGAKDLRLEDREIPEPKAGEVQLSIRSVGICGTDVGFWQKGRIGDYVVRSPMISGHEPSGVVTKLGADVTNVSVGDRVAVEPNQPCGICTYCKTGHYNVCTHLRYLAKPPTDGCMTRYCCHMANFVHKLPDHVSFDEGALVQPLSLGFYACQRGGVSLGHTVLVCGAGPLGMSVVLAAKARGAAKVCVTDINQARLDYIRQIGADVTVTVGEEEPRVTSRRVVEALGREPDVSLDCSGHPTATSTAIYSTRPTGTLVLIGLGGQQTVEIPLVIATLKELDICGMARFANCYPAVIEAIASGQVNVRQLVTHRFPLEQAMEAYNAALHRVGVKIIIDCQKQEN